MRGGAPSVVKTRNDWESLRRARASGHGRREHWTISEELTIETRSRLGVSLGRRERRGDVVSMHMLAGDRRPLVALFLLARPRAVPSALGAICYLFLVITSAARCSQRSLKRLRGSSFMIRRRTFDHMRGTVEEASAFSIVELGRSPSADGAMRLGSVTAYVRAPRVAVARRVHGAGRLRRQLACGTRSTIRASHGGPSGQTARGDG